MAHTQRNLVLGAFGAAVIGALIYVTYRSDPVPVDLHTVTRGEFEITVDVDGQTRVAELYEVSSPISGMALRAPVEVGDVVIANETVVAQVEPASPGLLDKRTRLQAEAHVREMAAALTLAEAARRKAAEDLVFAQTHYKRVARLVERKVSSITELETASQKQTIAMAAIEAADAQVAQAQSGLEVARAALVETSPEEANAICCIPILAPADGVVLEIDVVSARPVTPGTHLLSIGDPASLEIVADVLSADAVRLSEGAPAKVERWGGEALEARLLRVDPAARTKISALGIEEQRVDAIFEITTPPSERRKLGHGFAVFLSIVEYEEENALQIPLSSAFRVGGDWAVFRDAGGRAERVIIQVGRRNGRFAVVLSGLDEGDRVVEHPGADLANGMAIVERTTIR